MNSPLDPFAFSLPGMAGVNLPQVTNDQTGLPSGTSPNVIMGYNPYTGIFDLVQIEGNNADNETPVKTGLLKCNGYLYGYDETTDKWNRLRTSKNGSPGVVVMPGASEFSSAQITVTNASQSFHAADSNRMFVEIQNNDPAGIIYVNFGNVATSVNGYAIYPGGSQRWANPAPSNSINIIGSIASNANVVLTLG